MSFITSNSVLSPGCAEFIEFLMLVIVAMGSMVGRVVVISILTERFPPWLNDGLSLELNTSPFNALWGQNR